MSQKIQTDITRTGISLLMEESFYGHLFSGLIRVVGNTESISIQVAENKPSLVFNPDFWEKLEDGDLKYGYLKHQLLHLALKHPFQRENYTHKHIFDIAADLVVNQYLQAHRMDLDAVTMEKYPKLKKLPKGKDVGFYYRKILEISEENENPDSLPDENNEQLRQHQDWSSFGNLPRMEQRMMADALEDALVHAAERTDEKLMGTLPGGLLRLLREKMMRKEKQVNWRRVLRLFLGSGQRTYIKNTIRRPSKRYGTTPGIQVKNRQKVLVGLDTSGSITPNELATFFAEMLHMKKQGSEIMIAECDAQIQRVYPLGNKPQFEVKGGGGTDFNPILRFANEEYRPDLLVYFTDGYGSELEVESRCPMLWLITEDGVTPDSSLWKNLVGRKVKIIN